MTKQLRIDIDDELLERLRRMTAGTECDSVEELVVTLIQDEVYAYEEDSDSWPSDEELAEEDKRMDAAVEFDDSVRKLCIRYFFKEPRYRVDMSRYRAMVDRACDVDPAVKAGLGKYLDEQKILQKIYLNVRNHFMTGTLTAYVRGPLVEPLTKELPSFPTLDELDAQFQSELADVYRRADVTVAARLAANKAAG